MKYLRPVALAICLILAFTLGTVLSSHNSHIVRASTSTTLGVTCATLPQSTSANSAVVCVGDLDGTGTSKILLANMNSNQTYSAPSYWNVGVFNESTGYAIWARNINF